MYQLIIYCCYFFVLIFSLVSPVYDLHVDVVPTAVFEQYTGRELPNFEESDGTIF